VDDRGMDNMSVQPILSTGLPALFPIVIKTTKTASKTTHAIVDQGMKIRNK
jgi:hypothetical protein